MPCYTIKKTTVNVDAMQLSVLLDGLKAAGFDVRLDGETLSFSRKGSYNYHQYALGKLTLSGEAETETLVGDIKRAYSAQVVRVAASKFGWKLSETKTAQGVEFLAAKRR